MKRIIGITAIGILLCGCEQATNLYEDRKYEGTTVGVQRCIEKNGDSIIGQHAVARVCRERHENELWEGAVEGDWSVNQSSFVDCRFVFSAKNLTQDFMITFIAVEVGHPDDVDDEDNQRVERWQSIDLWVAPRVHTFDIFNVSLKFCPEAERFIDENGERLHQVDIHDVRGVEIKLR